MTIQEVASSITACSRCSLRKTCKSPLPPKYLSTTNSEPYWGILTGAPTKQEDKKRKHLVGTDGRILRRELGRAGLNPNEAAVFKTVSCYDPAETSPGIPKTASILDCKENLVAQWKALESVKVVLVVGKTALKALMPNSNKHTLYIPIRIHGKVIFPVPAVRTLMTNPSEVADFHNNLNSTFFLLASGMLDGHPVTGEDKRCAYCRKPSSAIWPYACKSDEHRRWWRRDREWQYRSSQQLGFDLWGV